VQGTAAGRSGGGNRPARPPKRPDRRRHPKRWIQSLKT
jgi:hypothetical protein